MARLAVMAHYDPTGGVGPHVRRQVEALAASFDDLVVVTTASLTDPARTWLSQRARLIERDNHGYDFFSYRTGLESAGVLDGRAAYDEVVICNDTYVGPLRDYARIRADMDGRQADFWGLTRNERIRPHLQSFFVAFRRPALDSEAFREFWTEMTPLSDRWKVVRRYEIGLTRRLEEAGLRPAAYFEPTAEELRLSRRRQRWLVLHREPLPRNRRQWRRVRQQLTGPANPAAGLADCVLDDARMPFVKLDTLRYDPYGLGADRLLAACEERFPDAFEGVRDYLAETARFYPGRPEDRLRPTPALLRPWASRVRYRVD